MQNNSNRAKQFMPFDALKGLKEEIKRREIIKENKKILSKEQNNYLDNIIKSLKKNNLVKIKYYKELNYIETIDKIKKIDNIYKKIYLSNTIINFDDIITIKII